jgi:hypothetical protein
MKLKLLNIEMSVRRVRHASNGFFSQQLDVKNYEGQRLDFFSRLCRNKRVLHVGCTDYPIFNPENNLHIQLAPIAATLDGLDTDAAGCEALRRYVPQRYFNDVSAVQEAYDVCLVPETIEHVPDAGSFLKSLSRVRAERFVFTAPNCFADAHMRRNVYDYNGGYVEEVHPDHKAWYSPFTLKNVIEKCSSFRVVEVAVIQYECSVACTCLRADSAISA